MNADFNDVDPRRQRVLVVDDDFTSRELVRLALEKSGYGVTAVDGVPAARREFAAQGFAAFDCVVTDYQMPEVSGLELLSWLKENASSLATIIVTAVGGQQLVADSLRGGAVDFLEKPVDLTKLRAAVRRAMLRTRQQQHLRELQSSVEAMGRTQQARVRRANSAKVPAQIDISFHPKLEAGGDSFSHFHPEPDKCYYLLADVSGHDLRAAYWSAYFEGVVRGMVESGRSLPEVFRFFNQLLLEASNHSSRSDPSTSVAVCAVSIDFKTRAASVVVCGTPAPVYVAPDGRASVLGGLGGMPLGWFEDFGAQVRHCDTAPGGSFLVWTDGLDDLAGKLGASSLSAGCALQQARLHGRRLEALASATDDILFVDILLSPAVQPAVRWQPLVLERYHGGQAALIDQFAALWSRCLDLTVPGLSETLRCDLLLAAREAVLNALQHGCRNDEQQLATFQISYEPVGRELRVWVSDPGPGHDFDLAAHEMALANDLLDRHRGLVLMRRLARSLIFERHGADVIMDFGPEPCEIQAISRL